MFLTIAQSLAVLTIDRAVDQLGEEIEPAVAATAGSVSHPIPFKCRIATRGDENGEMIRKIKIDHPWEEGDADLLQGLSHAQEMVCNTGSNLWHMERRRFIYHIQPRENNRTLTNFSMHIIVLEV